MAKFVIAGKSDCPFYSRAELLADELVLKVPNFAVHKIVINPSDWEEWVNKTCEQNGWNLATQSPLIWRELINRGGKGIVIGSCNDFMEYAKGYYGLVCSKSTDELKAISKENKETKEIDDKHEKERLAALNPFKIAITSADSSLAYHILPLICGDGILKNNPEISFSLHFQQDDEYSKNKINAFIMELQDCAHSQLRKIVSTTSLDKCLEQADLVVLLNLTKKIDDQFLLDIKNTALLLKKTIHEKTKIVYAGENAVICCNLLYKFMDGIPRENLVAMTRFEENVVKSAVAKMLEINSAGVHNLLVWGSTKEFIVDYSQSVVYGYNGALWGPHIESFSHSVNEMIYDRQFLDKRLPEKLNNNEFTISNKLLSFSAAFVAQMKDLMSQTNSKSMFSLGVVSDGCYDIPKGLIYSIPLSYTSDQGFSIVNDLELGETTMANIKRSAEELEKYCQELFQQVKEEL